MKYTLILLLVLTGCQKPAEQTNTANRFDVDTLFTHDGCTVYRFYDDRSVYFTNCKGQTQSTISCGKNCTTTQLNSTNVFSNE